MAEDPAPERAAAVPLRVALLSYRGKPHCGGQGVYVRALSRELLRLGHRVEVFSGPPYPDLDDGVALTRLPSLDLYRDPDPFRFPSPRELRHPIDVLELTHMWTAGFPEPLTFSLRAWRTLRRRLADFDVVHDNQGLGYGLLALRGGGVPVVATVHHPVSVDRRLDLAAERRWYRQVTLRRWYGFVRMQARVTRRLDHVLTVSRSAYDDMVDDFGVDPARVTVVPVGVDPETFAPPPPGRPRVPGRIVTTASADVPVKGLSHLLEAVAKARTEQDVELVVVGRARPGGKAARTIERLGIAECVRFVSGLPEPDLVTLLSSAEVAVVPSLYEGFSLPAVEAMACATPLVVTTGGALPEVVGDTALQVPPGDAAALAAALLRLLADPEERVRRGRLGRDRVLERYTWRATAESTVAWYRRAHDRVSRC